MEVHLNVASNVKPRGDNHTEDHREDSGLKYDIYCGACYNRKNNKVLISRLRRDWANNSSKRLEKYLADNRMESILIIVKWNVFFCFCFCQNNWIEIERCVARVRKCCQCSHLLVSFTVLIKEKKAFHWKEEKSVITTIDDDLISGESSTQGAVFNLRLRVRHLPVKSQQNVPVSPKKYLNHTFLYAVSVLGFKRRAAVSQL